VDSYDNKDINNRYSTRRLEEQKLSRNELIDNFTKAFLVLILIILIMSSPTLCNIMNIN